MQRTRKGAALSYSSMPSTEKGPVAFLLTKVSSVIQLNHNNAVAKATTIAAVYPFNLELGQFFPLYITYYFTITDSFRVEYSARKALKSWPRDKDINGIHLSLHVLCKYVCVVACFPKRFPCFVSRRLLPLKFPLFTEALSSEWCYAEDWAWTIHFSVPSVFGGLISAHKKVTYTFAHVNFLISGLI